ncbi:Siderophore-interacting protein [Actinobacteria bacterium OK074]|nr:Siderophore-interacting protein [Actinobacteria bacterium OK074]
MINAELHVVSVEQITPAMRRVTFGGAALAGFAPVAPDQQAKFFFARPGGTAEVPRPPADGDVNRWYQSYLAIPEAVRPWMRSYTVRRHLPERRQIEVDFVLHGDSRSDSHGGPAARWAAAARPGDVVGFLGPAVSHFRTPAPGARKLLAGDETALPAIGALVEALAPGERALVYAEVADAAEEQRWETAGEAEVHWLHRDGVEPGRSTLLLDAVRTARIPADGPVFAWVAGESSAVRALRRHLVTERALDKRAVAFTGYWRLDLTQDDAPTNEDVADREEVLAEQADAASRSGV